MSDCGGGEGEGFKWLLLGYSFYVYYQWPINTLISVVEIMFKNFCLFIKVI